MKIEGKKILVTGGQGFIGSHLVNALLNYDPEKIVVIDNLFIFKQGGWQHGWLDTEGSTVEFIEGDAGKEEDIGAALNALGGPADLCFNLAVMPLPHSLVHPIENFNNNVAIVANLLQFLKDRSIRRLLHFSSSEVYGSCQTSPMDESHPCEPSTPYAASKLACDQLILSYWKTYQSHVAIIRPFNNYGPYQNSGSYAGIIPKTIRALMEEKPLEVYGDGNQTRDYIYVEDTVRAAIQIGTNFDEVNGMVFNVASGKEVPINYLLSKIREIYISLVGPEKMRGIISHMPAREGDVRRHIGSAYLIEDVLGFKPTTGIDEGLLKTIKWYVGEL